MTNFAGSPVGHQVRQADNASISQVIGSVANHVFLLQAQVSRQHQRVGNQLEEQHRQGAIDNLVRIVTVALLGIVSGGTVAQVFTSDATKAFSGPWHGLLCLGAMLPLLSLALVTTIVAFLKPKRIELLAQRNTFRNYLHETMGRLVGGPYHLDGWVFVFFLVGGVAVLLGMVSRLAGGLRYWMLPPLGTIYLALCLLAKKVAHDALDSCRERQET